MNAPRAILPARLATVVAGWPGPVFDAIEAALQPHGDVFAVRHEVDVVDVEVPTWSLGVTAALTSPVVTAGSESIDTLIYVAVPTGLLELERADPGWRRAQVHNMTQVVTLWAAAAGVRHLVVITSSQVYQQPSPDVLPLPEDAPLRPFARGGVTGDAVVVEEMVADATRTYPGLAVSVLRPATLVGPGVASSSTTHFAAPRLLVMRGSEPVWQFCHVDDLASAVIVAAGSAPAHMAVSAPGWLTQDEVERLTGLRRIEVARSLAQATAQRLHAVGALRVSPDDLDDVYGARAVDPALLAARGWSAQFDNEQCVRVLMDGLHSRWQLPALRNQAAVGAASAAVAMVATAALLRRNKRKGV